MARHEGDFRRAAKGSLSLDELLALIGDAAEREGRSREETIACYLSGGDGWHEAVKLLGGTFAGEATELKERKGH